MKYCRCKKSQKKKIVVAAAASGAVLAAGITAWCVMKKKRTIPKGVTAVMPFDLNRYLGKWYEIARLDFRHEKNMSFVTAEYSLNNDGSVKVLNKGYDTKKGEWEESEGKAKFVNGENEAMLKVSFFGPFYAGYNVIGIDPEYKYALVAGEDRDYLWLLSREKTMPDDVKKEYLRQACKLGFEIHDLVWTEQ